MAGPRRHPLIACYAETAHAAHPLILMIGREPNCDEPISDQVGQYDFRSSPRCGFWNASYALVGHLAGLAAAEFKRECRQRGTSPLIYADALPHALPMAIRDKKMRRELIPDTVIRLHIERIVSQPICRRVHLVILSGLQDGVFDRPRALIERWCAESVVPLEHLPFFTNQNARSIRDALTSRAAQQIQFVLGEFLQEQRFSLPSA